MEKREISLEEKKRVQKDTIRIMLIITAVLAVDVIYMLVTKNLNMTLFQILLALFLVAYLVLSDVVEPLRLGMFQDISPEQKRGYVKMMVANLVGAGALIYWISGMNTDRANDLLFPLLIYFFSAQMKRRFRTEFEGDTQEKEQ